MGGGQLRARLIAELKLDAGQQAKLDPILEEMRGKFAALRELPEEQRAKAAAAVRADVRAKIDSILNPEQQARYAQIVAEMSGRGPQTMTRGRVWVLGADGKPKPIDVRVGLTDGTATEVASDELREGVEVIVGQQTGGAATQAPKGAPPRMFF
jgi:HlyD family secretion protein